MAFNYFTERDFDRANPRCKLSDMQEHFMKKLDAARDIAGVPFIINSAYRTKEHELKQGRDGTSSHCKGIAVDIRAGNSVARFRILTGLMRAGFTRIGIYGSFIHVDLDYEKDQDVAWVSLPEERNDHFGI